MIELHPTDCDYLELKIDFLKDLQRYEEAIECYDKAIELNPDNPEYWNKKANLLYKLDEVSFEEILKCYDKAIELNPKNPEYWENKVNMIGYPSIEEIECYDKLIKLEPDNEYHLWRKINSLKNLQRYEEAIECNGKLIELNPENPDYWKGKGFLLSIIVDTKKL